MAAVLLVTALNEHGIYTWLGVPKETGWLATPYKSEELAQGVELCVQNQAVLSKNCIEKSLRDFDTEKTLQKMVDIYSSL